PNGRGIALTPAVGALHGGPYVCGGSTCGAYGARTTSSAASVRTSSSAWPASAIAIPSSVPPPGPTSACACSWPRVRARAHTSRRSPNGYPRAAKPDHPPALGGDGPSARRHVAAGSAGATVLERAAALRVMAATLVLLGPIAQGPRTRAHGVMTYIHH